MAEVVRDSTLKTGYLIPPWSSDDREALINRLTETWLPPQFNRVHFTCGGSEAVESAIRIAIQHFSAQDRPEKYKIIGRDISYHGTTLAATAIAGHELRKRGVEHALQEYPTVETPYPLRCDHPDPCKYYVDAVDSKIQSEDPDSVAALIAEPIVGASGGAMVPPAGYWQGVRELCDKYNVLLICDEVMTGFGRTGINFGYQHWPIEPDIIVGGKGLAGGYGPLNGVFSTDYVAQPIQDAGFNVMFHTYGAYDPACAAANKVLEIMEREDLVERSRVMGEILASRLQAAFSNHPHVAEARGKGLLHAIEIVKNRSTLERYPESDNITGKVTAQAFKNGVYFYGGGTSQVRDVVMLGPSYTVNESEIDTMVNVLADAVDAVTNGAS